ncbi:hypothetical protein ACU8OG_09255 [Rhizobium leguminosarum]
MASQTALHESGHVLAALGHGIGVLHVSLDAGEVVLEPPGGSLEQGHHHGSLAVAYGIVALVGHAAAPKTEISKSDEQLLEHSLFLGSWADGRDEMRRALFALAERFVIEHREAIEKLALALDQRRSMSGAEVEEIVGSL